MKQLVGKKWKNCMKFSINMYIIMQGKEEYCAGQ